MKIETRGWSNGYFVGSIPIRCFKMIVNEKSYLFDNLTPHIDMELDETDVLLSDGILEIAETAITNFSTETKQRLSANEYYNVAKTFATFTLKKCGTNFIGLVGVEETPTPKLIELERIQDVLFKSEDIGLSILDLDILTSKYGLKL